MAQAKYSKLGYGNAEDIEAAIALGMLDGRDMIITKDSSEFMYVRDDLSVQKIRPRNRCFASVTEANEQLNETEDTYAGQTVMVKSLPILMVIASLSETTLCSRFTLVMA